MCMIQIVSNANTKYRYETLKNVDYLVVPVVMLNVGVHAGTVGPLMYTANQMKAAIHSWNLKPVVLNHPAGGSAADPVFLEAASVGILLNTQFNNDELTSEAWIEIDRLETLDADMLADIRAGKVIEVSTGLFAANSGEAGTFNNESYDGEAIDHQPDHLALLANAEGACSIKKGCGLQVQNAATDKTVSNDVYTLTLNASAAALSAIESLGGVILTKNKLSYADVQDKLHIALREKIDGYWEGWILAVYESVVIYRDGSRTFYLNYKVEDDKIGRAHV